MPFGNYINPTRGGMGNLRGILGRRPGQDVLQQPQPQQRFSMDPKTLQDLITFGQAGGNMGDIGGVPPGYWDWVRQEISPTGGGFGFPQRRGSILGR